MRLVIELMPSTRRRFRRSPMDIFGERFHRVFCRKMRRLGWLVSTISTVE